MLIASALVPVLLGASLQDEPATRTAPRAAAPSLARQLSEAFVYVECPDVKRLVDASRGLALFRVFGDEEVKDFLTSDARVRRVYERGAHAEVREIVRQENPDFPIEIVDSISEVLSKLDGRFTLAVQPDFARRGNDAVYASLDLGEGAPAFDRLVGQFADLIREKEGPLAARKLARDGVVYHEFGGQERSGEPVPGSLRIARRDGSAVLATCDENSILRLLGPAPAESLDGQALFREARAELQPKGPGLWAFLDGRTLLAQARGDHGGRDLQVLGLDRMRWMGLNLEVDGELVRHRFELRTEGSDGALNLFTTKKDFDLASRIPASACFSLQLAVDGPSSMAAFREMMVRFEPNGRDEYDRNMGRMRARLGTDLEELAHLLGGEVAFAAVLPRGGLIPDVYSILPAAKPEATQRLADVIELFARSAEREVNRIRLTHYAGKRIVYMTTEMGFVAPTLVVDGDAVVIGSSVAAVKRYIDFRRHGGESLANSPRFRDAMEPVRGDAATAYAWIDWTTIVAGLYGNVSQVLPLIGRAAAAESDPWMGEDPDQDDRDGRSLRFESGARFDFSRLPTAEAVARYVHPQAVRVRVAPSGITVESRAIF